jgi:hypothetical protein
MLRRVARNTAVACAAMALAAAAWAPARPRLAFGVLGGGLLVALSLWAISGFAGGLGAAEADGERRPVSRTSGLVKFFTRHAIIAVSGYVLMVRLHLDPVGMLIGVTSVVVAATVEAVRRH